MPGSVLKVERGNMAPEQMSLKSTLSPIQKHHVSTAYIQDYFGSNFVILTRLPKGVLKIFYCENEFLPVNRKFYCFVQVLGVLNMATPQI